MGFLVSAFLVVLTSSLWKVVLHLVWRPYVKTKAFRKQGLWGPAYKFWSGSTEEINRKRKAANEIILDKQSHDITVRVLPSIANGWINMMLTKEMAGCTKMMLEERQAQVLQEENQQKEIEVDNEFQTLTADIIAHTAFGSSYMEGKEVFLVQQKLQIMASESLFKIAIPGYRYLPTKRNLYRWKLEKILRSKLMGIIKERLESKDYTSGNDLLGLMMEANEEQGGQTMNMDEIIEECKTFFFAGHETTAHLLTWAMFLLSTNPDWQEKLSEVLQECATEIPNADTLGKLKMVNMVLLEALRLYCPVVAISRNATKDMTLGDINVTKDTVLQIPIATIHRDKEIWGADANEFNPMRFENGISKASKHPNALLAFSIGPGHCIGQNFAMMEAKTVIAMILQRFSFSLSQNYKHAPSQLITLQPEYDLPIVFRPLHI